MPLKWKSALRICQSSLVQFKPGIVSPYIYKVCSKRIVRSCELPDNIMCIALL